jgi:hypothetical protein
MNYHKDKNLWWVGVTTEPRHQIETYECLIEGADTVGAKSCVANDKSGSSTTTGETGPGMASADITNFFNSPGQSATGTIAFEKVISVSEDTTNGGETVYTYSTDSPDLELYNFVDDYLLGEFTGDNTFLTVGDPGSDLSSNIYEDVFLNDADRDAGMKITQAPWKYQTTTTVCGYNTRNVVKLDDEYGTNIYVVCLIKWKPGSTEGCVTFGESSTCWNIEAIFLTPDRCSNESSSGCSTSKKNQRDAFGDGCNTMVIWQSPTSSPTSTATLNAQSTAPLPGSGPVPDEYPCAKDFGPCECKASPSGNKTYYRKCHYDTFGWTCKGESERAGPSGCYWGPTDSAHLIEPGNTCEYTGQLGYIPCNN